MFRALAYTDSCTTSGAASVRFFASSLWCSELLSIVDGVAKKVGFSRLECLSEPLPFFFPDDKVPL